MCKTSQLEHHNLTETKEILSQLLKGNDIAIVDIIVEMVYDECIYCETETNHIPCQECKEEVCMDCYNENRCHNEDCEEPICKECESYGICDECGKLSCEDCSIEDIGYCEGCCEQFCLSNPECSRGYYRLVAPDGTIFYNCGYCLKDCKID